MKSEVDALDQLAAKQPKYLGKGGLCVGLVVTRIAQERGLPMEAESLRTEEGGQVSGLGKAQVQSILASHGIDRVLAEEGGRTSRGSLGLMRDYVEVLNELSGGGQPDLESIMAWWVAKVRLHFSRQGPKFVFDNGKSVEANIDSLFRQAFEIQSHSGGANFVGAMLQHLIGAKLDIVLGEGKLVHHGYSVADQSTDRDADFRIENVAIHVTTHPSESVVRKMSANLEKGLQPVIVTLKSGVEGARYLLANAKALTERVEVIDAIQFLTANVYERGLFSLDLRRASLRAIVMRYNEIVAACETDTVLRIALPDEG